MHKLLIVQLLIFLLFKFSNSLDNGLALTPPMGWLTWQRFRCNTDCKNDPENCISEHLIRVTADKMVEDGYLDAGYEYIIIDDCWLATTRDSNNRLQPDPDRFPSGIRALADYVHSKGLKFGIYEDFGTLTCGGYPGSIDHLELDAQTFADWAVDFLKLDGCYADATLMDDGYPKMGTYLNATNRPMVYLCEWPLYLKDTPITPNYTAIAENCNLWRNYEDVQDSFDSFYDIVRYYVSQQDILAKAQKPGAWNDPDMLIIGNFGLSYGQAQAQMALWSIFSAPLIMSVDLRTIAPWYRDILQNKNMLAINQDRLGVFGKQFLKKNGVEFWSKQLDGEKVAFVLLYAEPYGTPANVKISLHELGLTKFQVYNFYETWSGELIGQYKYTSMFNATVNPSGSVFTFWTEVSNKSGKPKHISSLSRKF